MMCLTRAYILLTPNDLHYLPTSTAAFRNTDLKIVNSIHSTTTLHRFSSNSREPSILLPKEIYQAHHHHVS